MSTMPMRAADIDYGPLTETLSRADIAAYEKLYPAKSSRSKVSLIVVGLIVVVNLLLLILLFFQPGSLEDMPEQMLALGGAWVFGLVILIAYVFLSNTKSKIQKKIRTYTFAQRNGFVYTPRDVPEAEDKKEQGTLFTGESAGSTTELLQLKFSGMPVKIGNYMYLVYAGGYAEYHRAYMRLTLPRRVPQMLLDAKANDLRMAGIKIAGSITNKYKGAQILSLEGDFDKYFTLYCPKEYERDALYIFTPDLMELLMKNAANYDVEIVDDALYVYHKDYFSLYRPETWQQLLSIAEVIHQKMGSQTDRYVDERAQTSPAAGVIETADRLRSKSGEMSTALWVIVGIIVVSAVYFIYLVLNPQFSGGMGT